MDIIVTDMTRFKNAAKLCIAGIDVSTRRCIRPMPYLNAQSCTERNILPGAILQGDLIPQREARKPHSEDHLYTNLTSMGPSSAEEFKAILEGSLSASVEDGFGVQIEKNAKYISDTTPPEISIITVKTDDISIVLDVYDSSKFRVIFTDAAGRTYWYLSVTDLGFFNYAQGNNTDAGRQKVNGFFRRQENIFLRIGLSRLYSSGDRTGYWLQVNGIYTFPDYLKELRCHS